MRSFCPTSWHDGITMISSPSYQTIQAKPSQANIHWNFFFLFHFHYTVGQYRYYYYYSLPIPFGHVTQTKIVSKVKTTTAINSYTNILLALSSGHSLCQTPLVLWRYVYVIKFMKFMDAEIIFTERKFLFLVILTMMIFLICREWSLKVRWLVAWSLTVSSFWGPHLSTSWRDWPVGVYTSRIFPYMMLLEMSFSWGNKAEHRYETCKRYF